MPQKEIPIIPGKAVQSNVVTHGFLAARQDCCRLSRHGGMDLEVWCILSIAHDNADLGIRDLSYYA
jgi:hypothetical protein